MSPSMMWRSVCHNNHNWLRMLLPSLDVSEKLEKAVVSVELRLKFARHVIEENEFANRVCFSVYGFFSFIFQKLNRWFLYFL